MKITVPISLGELYDKISILEIKKENIKDKQKLIHVNNELKLLKEIADKHPIENDLYVRLKRVNLYLWGVEDNIRIEEKNKDWGDDFINLARNVYRLNDERAEIKREINEQYESDIVEVKFYEKY